MKPPKGWQGGLWVAEEGLNDWIRNRSNNRINNRTSDGSNNRISDQIIELTLESTIGLTIELMIMLTRSWWSNNQTNDRYN